MIRKLIIAAASMLLLTASPSFADDDLDLSAYRGQVVVLDFWASWCVPCRRSFPWWNAMHQKYADEGLVIIGVNLDNDLNSAAEFLKEFPVDFRIHYDLEKDLAKSFGVQAMPSSYILGRDGEILEKHYGFKVKQQEELEALLVKALRSGDQ
jgi:cytochrome c biogenesis protein CcmG/thiol:disulfide interchange protein DsbE